MLKLFSPAKINLFLRVVAKRPDGYHELSSLFQAIDLGDFLHIATHPTDILTCTDSSIPTDGSNLVSKAIALFRRKTGIQNHFKVHLDKHIPAQAGLGGGSGNAATTLWACNQLSGNPATVEQLQAWSSEIGSDIPFFFSSGTAHCQGRGEKVTSLAAPRKRSIWIVKPSFGLSTPEVYSRVRVKPYSQNNKPDLQEILGGHVPYFNDLEIPAFEAAPQLLALKTQLIQSGYEQVLLCGSGSALFCLGSEQAPAISGLSTFHAQFINRDPAHWYSQ